MAKKPKSQAAGNVQADKSELLVGMKAICRFLGVSEPTALRMHRELDLPIKKSGTNGVWLGNRAKINEWSRDLAEAG